MPVPHLYRQVQDQVSQWIHPQDQRHLQVFCENVAAILQAQSACLSHWLPYLSHRDCKARSHMERLNYFVHNPKINAETFYFPLLEQFLTAWSGMPMTLTLDTSVLWDEYCLIEVCLVWGGRSIALGQTVLLHGSATVGFENYCSVLETTLRLLPPGCSVTLLADRGFEHGALIRWLRDHEWSWAIRAKSDLNITRSNGKTATVADLFPPEGYGVHTSLKIPPSTWFCHLGLGCAIALEACHCEENDEAIAKTTGLCDYFAPLSLRS